MTKMTSNSEESANIELDYFLGTTNSAENTETQDFNEVFIESIIVSNEAGNIPATPATEINSPSKKKIQKWTLEQMMAIIDDAKSSTDMKAASKHGVTEDVIQHWRKNEAKILASINEAKSSNMG